MRKRIAMTLALSLLLGPALPLLAEDAAAPLSSTAAAPAPDPNAPALPESSAAQDLSPTAAPSTEVKAAPVEVPKDVLAQPVQAKAEEKPARFRLGNFVLGFLGGALLGGAAGVLFGSTDSTGALSQDKLKVMLPLGLVGGGLLGGTLSLLLGATTPEEARPPKVESRRPGATPLLVASLHF